MADSVYYLPGHGGRLSKGLGEALMDRGFEICGRETVGEFRALRFADQVELVAEDLRTLCWNPHAQVIANSFGAYLFLHAQTLLPPFIGRVLLLSPIVGEFSEEGSSIGFIPPRPDRLLKLAQTGSYPTPMHCEIHVGAQDWQSNPDNVLKLAALLDLPVTVVPDAGHMLGKEYVGQLLDVWLMKAGGGD
jgi:hypothetical protein